MKRANQANDPASAQSGVGRAGAHASFDATIDNDGSGPPRAEGLPPELSRLKAYEVIGPMADGGMGVVYRARDVARDEVVALKTLAHIDVGAFDMLKREFRAVADISHENLVTLHELRLDEGVPYFTMELVDGPDLLTHVWGGPWPALRGEERYRVDEAALGRLRAALLQLADGVMALHDAGKLHRDLKPSNVMVSEDGRVVLLDFGLVLDREEEGTTRVAGTPAYMAPEQSRGRPLSPASDWYAVGIMLYQALTAKMPPGHSTQELVRTIFDGPVRPSSVAAGVPEDLDELCLQLLAVEPAARPSGEEVLRRLGREPVRVTVARPPPVGRERERRLLTEAFEDARRGAVVVHVEGASGMGKSTLVRHWLESVEDVGVVVLAARCHERESFSFKAFDGIIDALSTMIRASPSLAEDLPHAGALVRLFPALQRTIRAVPAAGANPSTMRRQGFEALEALLARAAGDDRLVIWLDDVQWSDADSADLLSEVLASASPRRWLWVFGSRREAVGGLPDTTVARLERGGLDVRRMTLGPLSPDERTALARRAAERWASEPSARPLSAAELVTLAGESGGHPMFVVQLVRDAQTRERAEARATTLDEALRRRLAELDEDGHALLETLAVAGRPSAQQDVLQVAKLAGHSWAVIAALRSQGLIDTDGASREDVVDITHDRIRQVVLSNLDAAALEARHRAFVEVLENRAEPNAAALAHHCFGAGMREDARRYALQAAAEASQGLAFERAASLYALARRCTPTGDRARHAELLERQGGALVDGGRGMEAVPLFRQAQAMVDDAKVLELRGRVAEQLMTTGRVDEGLSELRPVLARLGIAYPPTPTVAIPLLLWHLGRLKLRGLGFVPRAEGEVPQDDLWTIDVAWAAGKGLLSFDSIRAAHFLYAMLLAALDAGEPLRVSRALAIYGMMRVFEGAPVGQEEGRRALDAAERAAPADDRYLRGTITICRGTADMSVGRFREGLEQIEAGITILEEGCADVRWECSSGRSSTLNTLYWLGDFSGIARRAERWGRDGEQVGDLFGVVTAELYLGVAALAGGDLAEARRRGQRAMAQWSQSGFHYQHWLAAKIEIWSCLYAGQVEEARRHLEAAWGPLRRSGLLRVQLMALDAYLLRGHVALAAAPRGGRWRRRRRLEEALRSAAVLDRMGRTAAYGGAHLLRGQVALRRGEPCTADLETAAALFDRSGAALHARAVEWLSHAIAGDRVRVQEIEDRIGEAGVTEPARFVGLYVGPPR